MAELYRSWQEPIHPLICITWAFTLAKQPFAPGAAVRGASHRLGTADKLAAIAGGAASAPAQIADQRAEQQAQRADFTREDDREAQQVDRQAAQGDDAAGAATTKADPKKAAGGENSGVGEADKADAGDDEPPVSDEDAQRAYERGVVAGRRGMKPSLCPAEYRAAQRLFDAWNEGHAVGVAEARE